MEHVAHPDEERHNTALPAIVHVRNLFRCVKKIRTLEGYGASHRVLSREAVSNAAISPHYEGDQQALQELTARIEVLAKAMEITTPYPGKFNVHHIQNLGGP
eukprot:scaffold659233_cov86-Prasinocladus_malaysianus.AAC.1